MSGWLEGGLLTLALAAGCGAGWFVGLKAGLRMPSVWVSLLVLIAGSIGGPLVTMRCFGPLWWSHALAVFIAGFAAGITFWPMGQKQGEREWL